MKFSYLFALLPLLLFACGNSSSDESGEIIEEGMASWYGPGLQGNQTANGEVFDMNKMTAAHPELPFNTRVKVTNLENGKSVIVRINDRGPYAKKRIIDLSKAAAEKIGMLETGTTRVRIERLKPKKD